MRIRTLTIAGVAAGALLAVAVPLSASAHISVTPDSTAAGGYTVLTFALPHGCDGSPTTAIAIDIPAGIASVTPTVNPGWDVAKVADGDRTAQVVYTAKTPLPADLRDTFALSLQLPEDAAGQTLAFPVLQTCQAGSTEWNEPTPDSGEEPEHPAPAIVVTAATGDEHGHGGSDAAASEDTGHAGAASAAEPDVLARVLGITGLVVGAVGIVLAATARRRRPAAVEGEKG